jgi:hypothetical protein
VGNTACNPYAMKNGLKLVDLFDVVRRLQNTKGTSTAHFPALGEDVGF